MPLNPEFATNPDPRCACVLLLDTSSSMSGAPIDALNQGLKAFQADIEEDPLARRRLDLAIITFGHVVRKTQDFVVADGFRAPVLEAGGSTPLGEAIMTGVRMIQSRSEEYKANGVACYRPWMLMITDGAPTDEWQAAAELIKAEQAARHLVFFAVGVGEANMEILKSLTDRALKLDGLKFRELFLWLSASQKRVSASRVGDQVALPDASKFSAPV
jgi:uncharacterized protein YegL